MDITWYTIKQILIIIIGVSLAAYGVLTIEYCFHNQKIKKEKFRKSCLILSIILIIDGLTICLVNLIVQLALR